MNYQIIISRVDQFQFIASTTINGFTHVPHIPNTKFSTRDTEAASTQSLLRELRIPYLHLRPCVK